MVPRHDRLGSGGLAVIITEQAAEPITTMDRHAFVGGHGVGEGDDVGQSLVVPLGVKVGDVLGEETSNVPLAERHDPSEALLLDGTDEPLGVRIQVRTRRGEPQQQDVARGQDLLEVLGVERIAVDDQVVRA
jgi:hypothetical protein